MDGGPHPDVLVFQEEMANSAGRRLVSGSVRLLCEERWVVSDGAGGRELWDGCGGVALEMVVVPVAGSDLLSSCCVQADHGGEESEAKEGKRQERDEGRREGEK